MDEVLYRFFDAENNLLYVGISNNWQARLKQHYKDSEFHSETSYITLTRFQTRDQVEQAERIAIATEQPKYNKALNPNWENAQQHILKIKFWVYSNVQPDENHAGIVNELKSLFFEDDTWTRKNTAPIAMYLQEYLPEWSGQYNSKCEMCVNVYHSKQIETWADQYRRHLNAAN